MTTGAPEIRAVAYDVDGLLIDSEPHHVEAWQEALGQHHQKLEDLSPEFLATMAGRKPIDIARDMVQTLHLPVSEADFLALKHQIFWDTVADLKPMPGATESVHLLGESFLLGINTSLSRDHLAIVLGILGLKGSDFVSIVTSDRRVNGRPLRGKPDGESYQLLATGIGVQPAEMVGLEDAQSGVAAVIASGAHCIGVENRNAAPQDLSQADAVVRSLYEVTPALIRSLRSSH